MKSNLKLQLQVSDRVGLMADMASVMAGWDLNIVAMEVQRDPGHALVFLEVERTGQLPESQEMLDRLTQIPGVIDIRAIKTLPQEKREKRFQVVLDSISDGILSIDEEGVVAIVNRVAREMLGLRDREVVGRNLRDLDFPDTSILGCLDGRTYDNARRHLISERKRHQYLATGREIRDSRDRIVGAVEVMRDMKGVREQASAVAQPPRLTFGDLVGRSAAIRDAIAFAQKIAETGGIVSIRGESGTGKELFAGAMHEASGRSGPFVPINCAALPETLLESELFGYVGGAFSGARKEGKPGLFEIAQDGTLFLDEIAEMPLALQAKMLRVIQDGMVRRIGGTREVPANARIITATNRNLERLVEEGRFREDLYYRINVFPMHIPPLRERVEDIPLLAEHFLFQICSRLDKQAPLLSAAALDKLCRHRWPGNVREFRNVIERAAILTTAGEIGAGSILFSHELGRAAATGEVPPQAISTEEPLPVQLDRYERQIIDAALRRAKSLRQAARQLGVSHTTLQYKLRKHGITVE